MDSKVTGYILLVVGLIIILFASFQVIQVLTGNQTPIQVIHSQGISVDLSQLAASQGATQPIPSGQTAELISSKDLNEFTNLTLHYLLMTFLVSVGFRVSNLGVNLIRTITVKLNQKTA